LNTCTGCREQQTPDHLCLTCTEDLNSYLREIPDLYDELESYRLPGSVVASGPRVGRTSRLSAPSPVRLEVVDLLDRGLCLARLLKWTDSGSDVSVICSGFRSHLLSIVSEPWIGDFYRDMRALCRDLARTVGQPEERPVGKCSKPVDGDELCRGQLMRLDAGGVYCRRCGDKPALETRPVWLTDRETAMAVGRPLETIRTWIKRGRVGFRDAVMTEQGEWSSQIGPAPARRCWLPTAVALATEPQRSAIVNHGSRAELSTNTRELTPADLDSSSSDADVLDRVAPGNVTPSDGAPSGKASAPIHSNDQQARGGAAGAGEEVPADHPTAGTNP